MKKIEVDENGNVTFNVKDLPQVVEKNDLIVTEGETSWSWSSIYEDEMPTVDDLLAHAAALLHLQNKK